MTEKFIAIAPKGKEFMYKRSTMIAVPTSSAQKIVDLLNSQRFELKDGETWHVYDNDRISNYYIDREIKKYNATKVTIKYINRSK